MASIDDVISLSITKTTVTARRASFGIGLILASVPGVGWSERVRSYKNVSAVIADFPANGTVNHPVTDAAIKYFSQTPSPKILKVGRRANLPQETYTLTVQSAATTQGHIIAFSAQGTAISYTVLASETTSTVATALAALLGTVPGVSSGAIGAVITVLASTTGPILSISGVRTTDLYIANVTPDPGIAADLAAVRAEDDNFHDWALDSQSHAQIVAAAAINATLQKEFWFDSQETLAGTTSTTDVFSVLKAALYDNTNGFYNGQSSRNYRCMAAMAVALVRDPGSYTLKFKALTGDEGGDALSDSFDGYLALKNANRYQDIGAGPMLMEGVASSGYFEDNTRFLHWVTQELKARALEAIAGPAKAPFTNDGIALVENAIRGVLKTGIERGGIADDPGFGPVVGVPDALDVPTADRAVRQLTGVEFSFRLAGAIHGVTIQGSVTV